MKPKAICNKSQSIGQPPSQQQERLQPANAPDHLAVKVRVKRPSFYFPHQVTDVERDHQEEHRPDALLNPTGRVANDRVTRNKVHQHIAANPMGRHN